MEKTFDNIYFIDSELSEQVRQNLMCIFLENLINQPYVQIDWNAFVDQWRLGIAESVLEFPERVFQPGGLEALILMELDLQLMEFQIEDLKKEDKVSLCRMWYPEALGNRVFQGTPDHKSILLPLSLLHGVTLLNLFRQQLVNGETFLSDEVLDSYALELDSFKNIARWLNVPLSEMNILSADQQSREALEILGLKKNYLYHQFICEHDEESFSLIRTA